MTSKFIAIALLIGVALTGGGPLEIGTRAAHAVIGRPFTPVSVAGVARRSARRSAYYGGGAPGYRGGIYNGAAVGMVAGIPPSCGPYMNGTYTCGSTHYRPYYSGTTVVYHTEP
jgi:hypothetical protein